MRKEGAGVPDIQTDRLSIVTFSLDLMWAALHDRVALADRLRARVPAAWPGPDYAEVLPGQLRNLEPDPDAAIWSALLVHRADATLVGDAGFLGGPDPYGTVEIGYSIVPAYRGHGLATEAVQALTVWAFNQPGVCRVVASCAPDNRASIRVLEKAGFRHRGDIDKDGLLRWDRYPGDA
ncbi:MAG: GNAT family N-acetyltransferase [Chloroflexota bacterium]|nr:GNAT family N-acetyltransferase [Chloroflexota bacterium]